MTRDWALVLFKAGIIDHWTFAEWMDIPNMGHPPQWADSIVKRLAAEGVILGTRGKKMREAKLPAIVAVLIAGLIVGLMLGKWQR